MNKNREVLKHCPHFYSIINFEFYKNDLITEKLINIYKNYIFGVDLSNIDEINKVEKLDTVLFEYINDYAFRNQVKENILTISIKKCENVLEAMVNAIINFFDNYEKLKFRKVQVTRWI